MRNINDLENKIKNKENLLMILDYDGVVTPTEPNRNRSSFNSMFKRILVNLAQKDYIKIKIITGRTISDFKEKFEIDTNNIEIYGVYGAEVENNKSGIKADDNLINDINCFFSELKEKCSRLEKINVENKKYSVVMNYWQASDSDAKVGISTFKKLAKKYNTENNLKIIEKGKSMEIISVNVKKENIIDKVYTENPDFTLIYIGDDRLLINKTKELNGFAIGIQPLCPQGMKLVNFSISQNKFEEFLINVNNLYL